MSRNKLRTGARRANYPPSPEWSPMELSPALWLTADAGLYQDAAGTTAATADTHPVGLWQDQSGNSRHFSQSTGGNRPSLKLNIMNGRPVVRFATGGTQFLEASSFFTGTTGTVVASFQINNTADLTQILFASSDTASSTRMVVLYGYGYSVTPTAMGSLRVYQRNDDTGDSVEVTSINADAPLRQTTPYIGTWASNGTAYTLRVDGLTHAKNVLSGSDGGDWFGDTADRDNVTIGALKYTTVAQYLRGDIRQLLAFDTVLSASDLARVEYYLMQDIDSNRWEKTTLDLTAGVGRSDVANPVIAVGGATDSDRYIREPSNVLYEAADTGQEYKIWYTGYNAGASTDEKIHYATSSNGTSWTKYVSNPIIAGRAEDPFVVKSGSTYYLYAEDKASGTEDAIRVWTSTNLTVWTDQGQIKDSLGTPIADCQSPTVIIDSGTWYMLYELYPTAPQDTRLATSSDGLVWADQGSVFGVADTGWADVGSAVVPDDVFKIGSLFYMFYHAKKDTLYTSGIAWSSDMENWTDLGAPVRSRMAVGEYGLMAVNDGTSAMMYWPAGDTYGLYRGFPLRKAM